jgi:hypothetical protein
LASITTSFFRASDAPGLSLVLPDNTAVQLNDVSSLWYRRLRAPERPDDVSPGVYDFCVRETMDTLLGSLLVSRVAIMSHPQCIWAAEHKIFQLAVARSLGLQIPETVVTNDPEEVRQAFHRFGGRMVAKAVRTGFVNDEGRETAIYTSLVCEEHLRNLETARWSPAIYQQLIEKACDVRATVVGEKLFVAEIDSQTDASAAIDWRRTSNPALPIDEVRFPSDSLKPCAISSGG